MRSRCQDTSAASYFKGNNLNILLCGGKIIKKISLGNDQEVLTKRVLNISGLLTGIVSGINLPTWLAVMLTAFLFLFWL